MTVKPLAKANQKWFGHPEFMLCMFVCVCVSGGRQIAFLVSLICHTRRRRQRQASTQSKRWYATQSTKGHINFLCPSIEALPRQRFPRPDSFSWLHKWICCAAVEAAPRICPCIWAKSFKRLHQMRWNTIMWHPFKEMGGRKALRKQVMKNWHLSAPWCVFTLRIRSVLRYACLMFQPAWIECVCMARSSWWHAKHLCKMLILSLVLDIRAVWRAVRASKAVSLVVFVRLRKHCDSRIFYAISCTKSNKS